MTVRDRYLETYISLEGTLKTERCHDVKFVTPGGTVGYRYGRIGATSDDEVGSMKHDDVINWNHFPRPWPYVRGTHRSTVNFPHKGK